METVEQMDKEPSDL